MKCSPMAHRTHGSCYSRSIQRSLDFGTVWQGIPLQILALAELFSWLSRSHRKAACMFAVSCDARSPLRSELPSRELSSDNRTRAAFRTRPQIHLWCTMTRVAHSSPQLPG